MKKIFKVSMALLLMMSSVNLSNGSTLVGDKCASYAIAAADAEQDHYGPMTTEEWADAALWYMAACDAAGGNIQDPVFL